MSTPAPARTASTDRHLGLGWALVLDLVVILVFAAVGRRSHDEGDALTGVLRTAWPFLAGGALGYLANLAALRRAAASVSAGVVVWVCTVAGGMVLRHLTDKGTAFSFIVVATIFTGVFLLGWRALAGWLIGRRTAWRA
jgi:peptidoglycan/LPS O-acetylase OafA/YrhL